MVDPNGDYTTELGAGAIGVRFDKSAVARLSGTELESLSAAVGTLQDVACGLVCQPRFRKGDSTSRNRAGEFMEDVLELLNLVREEVERGVGLFRPESADDVNAIFRSRAILAIDNREGPLAVAQLAVTASAAMARPTQVGP